MAGKIMAFQKANVDKAPVAHGVYALYQNGELIYIGRASGTNVTIRSRLQSHLSGVEGACTKAADGYWREPCTNPRNREKELLEWYQGKYGKLPRCNERIG